MTSNVAPATDETATSRTRTESIIREPVMATAARPRAGLTVAEFCAEWGISRSTFYDWRTKGRAPRCIKLPNGDLRIRRADIERWLDALDEVA